MQFVPEDGLYIKTLLATILSVCSSSEDPDQTKIPYIAYSNQSLRSKIEHFCTSAIASVVVFVGLIMYYDDNIMVIH